MEDYGDAEKEIYEKYSFLTSDDLLYNIKELSLDELGYITKNLTKFLSFHKTNIDDDVCVIPKVAELIVNFGLVKSFENNEDRDYDSKDFPGIAENAEQCFTHLNFLLPYYEGISTSYKRKFLVPCILFCASHSDHYPWSNNESVSLCKDFLSKLLIHSKHKNLHHLLSDDTFHPTIFKGVLKWMRPSLMKETWSKNPSSCYVFYWLLSSVKHPYLIDYLPDVLPPAFMFTSYYAVPQQVLGIKCFNHILDNVSPSLIIANGTEDAIFDALKSYIYSKEVPIIKVLYPCLLKLPMMNLQKGKQIAWLQFDVVLNQLLMNLDMESNPELRHLFLNQVHLFIQVIPCFKHLKKTLQMIYKNLTANSIIEEKCRIVSLKILKDVIKSCTERIENHCFDIILAVLKVMCDIEYPSYTMEDNLSKEVLKLCEECFYLLKTTCPKSFENLVNEYLEGEEALPGSMQLKKMLK